VLLKLKAASGKCAAAKQLLAALLTQTGLSERVKIGAQALVDGCLSDKTAAAH
jgi:hypothetical protein